MPRREFKVLESEDQQKIHIEFNALISPLKKHLLENKQDILNLNDPDRTLEKSEQEKRQKILTELTVLLSQLKAHIAGNRFIGVEINSKLNRLEILLLTEKE
jgi:Zn-dependent M16 (insulinase) family peptidase